MTWERALEADARLAAKNAVLIRAALRQSFDPERAFIGYQNTQPDESLTLPQQRSRARAWAIMNVRPNLEPLRGVLFRIWAEAYALGDTAAREAIEEAKQLQKADTEATVDWSKWKPGDAASAILLKPPRAFQQLLQAAGITLKGFSDTTLTDIGNAIGEAIELGLDAKRSAKNILNHVANPARALSIAITEQNRAISAATINRYQEVGIQEIEWLVFEPCDICAKNANQKVRINAPFPSGDTQPPAHPHCRCALAPVIPGFDDPANTAGTVTTPSITPEQTISEKPFVPDKASATWTTVTNERWRERQTALRLENDMPPPNDIQIAIIDQQYKDAESIYEKGPHALIVNKNVKTLTPQHIETFRNHLDEVYEKLPEWRKYTPEGVQRRYTYIIDAKVGGKTGNTLAYTYTGHDTIWFSPKSVGRSLDAPRRPSGKIDMSFALPGTDTRTFWSMTAAYDINETKYDIAHEFGHTVDMLWNQTERGRFVGGLRRRFKEGAWWSKYGRQDPEEAYAEVFAQWLLGEKTPVTDAFAAKYGWDLTSEEYQKQIEKKWRGSIRPKGGME